MNIVLYEMKKIWNLKLLLIIVTLCALFFFLFMDFYIVYYPNGHPETEAVNYATQMIDQYGLSLDRKEYDEFIKKEEADIYSKIETYIKTNSIFSDAKIYTFEDFEKVYEKESPTQLEAHAIESLLSEESDYILYKLQTLQSIESSYDVDFNEFLNEKEQLRLDKLQYAEKYHNIMSIGTFSNTVMYLTYFSRLAILAVLLFVAPLVISDRIKNLHLLQYTSKSGRKVFNHQFAAVILSAFLLTTVLLLVFGTIYSINETSQFWNNRLISFMNPGVFWFDISYGQYIVLFVIFLYLLCLGTASIVFVLSRYSQNIITLILKLIPAVVAFWTLCSGVFFNTFSSSNTLYKLTKIFGIEPIICSCILMMGFIASFYIMKRERKIDTF